MNSPFFASLRFRILALITATTLVVVAVVNFVWSPAALEYLRKAKSVDIEHQIEILGDGLVPFILQNEFAGVFETIDSIKERQSEWAFVEFYFDNGKRIYPLSGEMPDADENSILLDRQVIFRGQSLGHLKVLVDISEQNEWLAAQSRNITLTLAIILTLGAAVLILALERIVTRPAIELTDAANELAQGNYQAKLPKTGTGEIAVLANSFRKMREIIFENQRSLIEAKEVAETAARAKSRFLAVMSHEIRTPLNGLLGLLELLGKTELSKPQEGYINLMKTSGALLQNHVNDVLAISRVESEQAEIKYAPLDLHNVINDIIDMQQTSAKLNGNWIVCMPDVRLGLVESEQGFLRHVLLNLISNANKFTQDGTIEVRTKRSDDGSSFSIAVTDTGIGISPENLESIFEDFVTLAPEKSDRYEGAGLGLGIARRLTKALGGSLTVQSTKGVGSTFTITLPLVEIEKPAEQPEDSKPKETLPSDANDYTGVKVLLAEDNAINRVVAATMLTDMGITVVEAEDGQDAYEVTAKERFDLIVMDISMPLINGRECTQLIRANEMGPNHVTPIVALTAHAFDEDVDGLINDGFNLVLTKPISGERLVEAIRSFDLTEEQKKARAI